MLAFFGLFVLLLAASTTAADAYQVEVVELSDTSAEAYVQELMSSDVYATSLTLLRRLRVAGAGKASQGVLGVRCCTRTISRHEQVWSQIPKKRSDPDTQPLGRPCTTKEVQKTIEELEKPLPETGDLSALERSLAVISLELAHFTQPDIAASFLITNGKLTSVKLNPSLAVCVAPSTGSATEQSGPALGKEPAWDSQFARGARP